MSDMTEQFDTCDFCCAWCRELEEKSPVAVRDAYPKMMRKVLKVEFGMPKKAADGFIESACCGNWLKLHETDVERNVGAESYAEMLRSEVFYCSDRWSWDRVLRTQWLYMMLVDRCRRWES